MSDRHQTNKLQTLSCVSCGGGIISRSTEPEHMHGGAGSLQFEKEHSSAQIMQESVF